MSAATVTTPRFAELLSRALVEPGVVSRAYTAFHGYSLGNQLLALVQCAERGITPGRSARFKAGRVSRIRRVQVGSHADWHTISDHVPLIIDIDA